MEGKFTGRIIKDMKAMDTLLHVELNADIKVREFRFLTYRTAIFYLEGMVSSNALHAYVIKPCLLAGEIQSLSGSIKEMLTQEVICASGIEPQSIVQEAAQAVMDGQAVLLCEGMDCSLMLDIREFAKRGVSPPQTESVVIGQHQGFNESLRDNVTLIRRLVHSTELIGETMTVGKKMPTAIELMYLHGVARPELVERIKGRLEKLDLDWVPSIHVLEQLLEDNPYKLFPQILSTERPDRASSFLLEGQIIIVMDGSPMVLAMPISVLHLIHTSEDNNMRWQYGTFIRIIRLLGMWATLYLPGTFVALTMYHMEAMPLMLLSAIVESQSTVPLTIFGEMVMMLLMFNLITEAGTRVPGLLGNSVGIVAGLILGQAAVEAKLVNPLLIIVVAIASLGGHGIPDYSLSIAFRILQMVLLFAAAAGGFMGMVIVSVVFVSGLCNETSLGVPYLAPVSPKRSHNMDMFARMPIWHLRYPSYTADDHAPKRSNGRMRGWEGKE